MSQNTCAVPAYPGTIKVHQADGTEISIRLHGDEFGHYTTTEDGYPIIFNSITNNYEYATLKNGKVEGCGIVAANATSRTANVKSFLTTVDKEAIISKALAKRKATKEMRDKAMKDLQAEQMKAAGKKPMKQLMNDFPHFGEQHSLVILLEFNNCSFSVIDDPHQFYSDALNKEGFTYKNGATGSARDFFIASSNGAFMPTFDVYGPVKIDYGVNDAGTGDQLTAINTGTFLKAAVAQLDGKIDFKQYDHDGDGYVDNIYLYYAGYGAADSGRKDVLWPHSFNLEGWNTSYTTSDGVKIGQYTCSNEIDGLRPEYPCGIGTFVHEFGHCLGLMDHYDVNYKVQSKAPGFWDTMATGSYNNNSNTPPLYSSYECYELGWTNPEELTCKTDTVNILPYLGSSNKAYRMAVPGNENEYYLFENRQKTGWDQYLPGHGMLVWHIDFDYDLWDANSVNTDGLHQHIDIVEANGEDSGGYSRLGGIPFPGTDNVTTYDFKAWNKNSLIQLDKIKEDNEVISFIVKGSDSGITTPQATISDVDYESFKCSWNEVAGAEYYLLNVGKVTQNGKVEKLATYTNKIISENETVIDRLDEDTEYEISIESGSGSFTSDAVTLRTVTTIKPFDKYKVEKTAASEITSKSFKASWSTVKDAQSYVVNLTKIDYNGENTTTACDFANKEYSLPEGWRSSTTNYSTANGTYGQNSPSLRFGLNRSYLIMQNKDAKISEIEFWMKGSSVTDGTTVEVDRMDNDEKWQTVEQIAVTQNGQNYKVSLQPTTKARLYFNRKGSSVVYLDDVTVSGYAPKEITLPAYTNKNIGINNSFVFDNLEQNTTYSLIVYGENNGQKTLASDAIKITTKEEASGIEVMTANDDSKDYVYDLYGRNVSLKNSLSGIYIIKKEGKATKITVTK